MTAYQRADERGSHWVGCWADLTEQQWDAHWADTLVRCWAALTAERSAAPMESSKVAPTVAQRAGPRAAS